VPFIEEATGPKFTSIAKKNGAHLLQGSFVFKLNANGDGTSTWFKKLDEGNFDQLIGDSLKALQTGTTSQAYEYQGIGTTITITSSLDDQEDFEKVTFIVEGPPQPTSKMFEP